MFKYLLNLFISIDQFINVLLSPILNLMLKSSKNKFGNPDETLSSVMGKNVREGTCKGCYFICRLLHPIDRNHCLKSIEEDE